MTEKELIPIGDSGISLSPMGANIPSEITYEQAEEAIRTLTRLGGAVTWALADTIAMSMGTWGSMYDQMMEATQLSQGTLQNMMTVWRRFPTLDSRLWDLSFSHYRAVSVDYIDNETRAVILEHAEEKGLSRDAVRDIVKAYGPRPIVQPFSKEVFIGKLSKLIEWAEGNDAPPELIEAVKELFRDFKQEPDWNFMA